MTVPEGRIRNATLPEVELIQGIERRAESVFSPTDLPVQIRHGLSAETLARGILNHNLWVSVGNDDVPVGFALTVIYGSDMHLEEISVDPDSSRKGHGRALVDTVIQSAVDRNFARVTLTTFSHIVWNRPFYESCGFDVISNLEPENELRSKLLEEQQLGLTNRVAMARWSNA